MGIGTILFFWALTASIVIPKINRYIIVHTYFAWLVREAIQKIHKFYDTRGEWNGKIRGISIWQATHLRTHVIALKICKFDEEFDGIKGFGGLCFIAGRRGGGEEGVSSCCWWCHLWWICGWLEMTGPYTHGGGGRYGLCWLHWWIIYAKIGVVAFCWHCLCYPWNCCWRYHP